MNTILYQGDSGKIDIPNLNIDLLLTCPPYYHPKNMDEAKFGISPNSKDLNQYLIEIGTILEKWNSCLKLGGVMVIVKTDFWYKNRAFLVGFELARHLQNNNVRLLKHWIWQHSESYSPYSPSFANIFVFGKGKVDKNFNGIIKSPKKRNNISNLHYIEVYEFLINCLSREGELVFDPFAGTGSVLKAAFLNKRCSVGIEISENQIRKAKKLFYDIPLEIITP